LNSEYIIHIDFAEMRNEITKLRGLDEAMVKKIQVFVDSLEETAASIDPAMKRETHDDERELLREYQLLQREKLIVLDLSHEWEYIKETVRGINPKLDILVKDAIQELTDHIATLAETHKAHIDILEIYNTRKIEVLALIITAVVSYLAVWEFFVRDLLAGLAFPNHLSPSLNYVIVVISLLPVFFTVIWTWAKRRSYF
jgi:hypothetical protein